MTKNILEVVILTKSCDNVPFNKFSATFAFCAEQSLIIFAAIVFALLAKEASLR